MKSLFTIIIIFVVFAVNAQYLIVRNLLFSGNKKTKTFIIERELTFKRGDTLWLPFLRQELDKSAENILKTQLFNFAELDTIHASNHETDIIISVTERWYLWPIPIFEQASRNINTWIYEKDYDKVNYGIFVAQANFRGRNELIRAIARFGFREQYGFAYTIPHFMNSPKFGLELKALYYRQKQLAYKNKNNKPLYVISNKYLYQNSDFSINFSYRPKLYAFHNLEIAFAHHLIHDSLYILNPDFLFDSLTKMNYTSISYYFRYDKTNSVAYPTKGFFIEQTIENKTFLDNLKNIQTFDAKGAYYYKLSNHIFNAHGLSFSYSGVSQKSYLLNKAFGYRTSPRGYELYLVDGNAYILTQNSIRFMIVKPTIKNIYKLKNERFAKLHYAFYLSINGDAGYVFNQFNEPLTNQWLYGYGIGLDFVTYYDITLRTEYSINQFGNKGLYFHFSTFI